ncbi:hypothetical protein [Ectobacillus ponti]|uniref:Uncharacterized protein n=1 Tax=Ectobacillus ponti TaxID=2961894 RepID=A0AA41XBF9_9BACI|nr:hypothetical protein [Ectobacillus ponti]MCP8968956.1 hypothetical protein [Ectobacillus ponti]
MKHILPLFCLEMLTVLLLAYRAYTRWEFSLILCIGLVVLAVVLLVAFHKQYEKCREPEAGK